MRLHNLTKDLISKELMNFIKNHLKLLHALKKINLIFVDESNFSRNNIIPLKFIHEILKIALGVRPLLSLNSMASISRLSKMQTIPPSFAIHPGILFSKLNNDRNKFDFHDNDPSSFTFDFMINFKEIINKMITISLILDSRLTLCIELLSVLSLLGGLLITI